MKRKFLGLFTVFELVWLIGLAVVFFIITYLLGC